MNSIQIQKVLTKLVKYFQGLYRFDLIISTLIKPAINVINLDKYYMPASLSVFPILGTPNILIRTDYLH